MDANLSSSDIISHSSAIVLKDGSNAELLHFRDHKVLAISRNGLAFYQDQSGVLDDFNQGLLASCEIPSDKILPDVDTFVAEFKAGFVGLVDDKALLITPVAIQLFDNKTDALYNRSEICRLDLMS